MLDRLFGHRLQGRTASTPGERAQLQHPFDATRYASVNGGKRCRPFFDVVTADLFDEPVSRNAPYHRII